MPFEKNSLTAKKIFVIGSSCSGKTTLVKRLNEFLQYKWVDLDNLHWLPNWQERPDAVFVELIHSEIMCQERWIVSGGYHSLTEDNLWQDADTIIWLNYSLSLILYRYFTRTYRRVRFKEKCCNGNIQTWRRAISIEDNLLQYILTGYYPRIKRFENYKTGPFKDKKWIILKKPSDEQNIMELLKDNTS